MTPAQDLAQVVKGIEADFPGWNVFRSDKGRWWAWDSHVTHQQVLGGCSATVDGDTPGDLRSELLKQKCKRIELVTSPLMVTS
ncbi:hypothetical protein GCM10009525_83780 [Streptosporangium amethystogenes subsp. fukuiense]